jgi:pyruvate dehydrogenase E2 component (dihydrolipoamide acetyltransferase)
MATPVEVPKLGNTVEECLVARWCKHKGDPVSAGDVVAEIETDKATFEVTAPVDGTVLETFFDEGSLVPVFTNLFVIGAPGESPAPFRPQPASAAADSGAGNLGGTGDSPVASPGQRAGESPAPPKTGQEACPTSPRARRFADEHNFHPAAITGSGPGGRVVEQDVRALYYSGPAPQDTSQGTSPGPLPTVTAPLGGARPAPRASTIREKIARRMRESLATTAQYTLNTSARASALLSLRARIKSVSEININDLVTFCAIQALLQIPDLNAEFIDGVIHKHSAIHIGFACDTPRGLLVPVVRDAHRLPIVELARQMKELTAQAVQGGISADRLSGATFTISNLGNLGIESFTPLLNPPQVAILGVGAIQLKPVRREGNIEFIDCLGLSLTCDHQVIDGAPGARFLQVLREKIENVEQLCTI